MSRAGRVAGRWGGDGGLRGGRAHGRDRWRVAGRRDGPVAAGRRRLPGATPRGGRALDPMPPEAAAAVVIDLLAAACATGVPVPRALEAVGHAIGGSRGADLNRAAGALAWGAPWRDAWAGCEQVLLPVAEALRPSWEDGAPPAGPLAAAAEQERRDHHSRALEAASRLGVRLVLPLGLCYLPAFVLVGLVPVLVSLAAGTLTR